MSVVEERLERYFMEAKCHIDKMESARTVLRSAMPLSSESLAKLDERAQDKLDILLFRFAKLQILLFRFAKLQDLLGFKIFRTLLSYSGFDTDVAFVEILAELERAGLIETDRWLALRDARNAVAHEYPGETDHIIRELNFIYEEVEYLIALTKRFEEYYNAIKSKRAARD